MNSKYPNSTYIICFWDKSKLQVSWETGEKLKEIILNNSAKNFMLFDNLYSIAGIEKIIDKDTAYEVFPSEYEFLKNLETSFTEEECNEDNTTQLQNSKPKQLTN